jgi:hypothetical protein
MKTLEGLIQTQLPINRKEVFFTATVLPMIIAKDNFKHLHLLLKALDIEPVPKIVALPSCTNIQFFTEYNLLESLSGAGREQDFQDDNSMSPTGVTPDLMILIDKLLIVLEAKMYTQSSAADLETQMNKQKEMLNIVKQTLGIEYYHFALLPQKLAKRIGKETLEDGVITWEEIRDLFEPVAKDDYFMTMLKIALDSYDTLASSFESNYGKNNEKMMKGQEIYDLFKKNTLEYQFMGRKEGFDGERLKKDLNNDGWKTQNYETRKTELLKKNWFSVEEFVKKIDSK